MSAFFSLLVFFFLVVSWLEKKDVKVQTVVSQIEFITQQIRVRFPYSAQQQCLYKVGESFLLGGLLH